MAHDSQALKVAVFVEGFPRLSETFILSHIAGLIKRGCAVTIVSADRSEDHDHHPVVDALGLMDRTIYIDVPRTAPARMWSAARIFTRMLWHNPRAAFGALNVFAHGRIAANLRLIHWYAALHGKKFDIFHCHFGPVGVFGAHLAALGIPGELITTFHGYDVGSYARAAGAGIYRRLFNVGRRFTVNSRSTLTKLTALGCPPEKITLVPMGIDLAEFTFRERTLADGEPMKLLTVGRLVGKKGHEFALKAVAGIVRTHPNVRYHIVGDGPDRERLEVLARSLGIAGVVEFTGALDADSVKNQYDDAHIFLLASVTDETGDCEGQGVVLQEAQASGLPVLATRHNGFPEGVDEGVSAYLVPERDPETLGERLAYLADNPEHWPEMGRAGRAFVESRFTVTRMNDTFMELYAALLSK